MSSNEIVVLPTVGTTLGWVHVSDSTVVNHDSPTAAVTYGASKSSVSLSLSVTPLTRGIITGASTSSDSVVVR